jgi:ComEC/Rec2-related protein
MGNNIRVEIKTTNKIKKKYLVVEIKNAVDSLSAILFFQEPISYNQTYNCHSNKLILTKVSTENSFYEFLKDYNYIYIQMKDCELISEEKTISQSIKDRVESSLQEGGLEKTSREIAMGIIFGDISYLNSELKNSSLEGGVIHLFAASGLHMGIIIGVLYFICNKIIKFNYFYSKIIPVLIGFIYLYLLNFPVSLFRAYFFACFWLVSKVFFRKSKPINMIIICFTFVYVFQRDSFLSIGFLLSFGATIGIIYFKQILDKILFNNYQNFLSQNITISLSASIGTFPFLVYFFKAFSYGSLLLNIIIVPLAGFVLPILYFSLFIHQIGIELISNPFWTLCDLFLRTIIFLTFYLSEQFGFFKKYKDIEYQMILLYFLFILIILFINYNYKPDNIFKSKIKNEIYYLYSPIKIKIIFIFNYIKELIISFIIPISIVLFLIIFSFIGYNINVIDSIHLKSILYVNYNIFVIEENKNLFIEGDCKYIYRYLVKIEKSEIVKYLNEIHISNLSCISFALKNKVHSKIFFHKSFYNKKEDSIMVSKILNSFPEIKKSNEFMPRVFKDRQIIFFAPHLESLYDLKNSSQSGEGSIYLLFPFKSLDTPKEWNDNKKLLGISDRWKFYSNTEL